MPKAKSKSKARGKSKSRGSGKSRTPAKTRKTSRSTKARSRILSFGPSPSDIAKAVGQWFEKSFKPWLERNLVKPVGSLPGKVTDGVGALLDGLSKETRTLWTNTKSTIAHAEAAVKEAAVFLVMLATQYRSWTRKREKPCRADLVEFFGGLFAVMDQVSRILVDIKFDLQGTFHPLVNDIVSKVPGPVLFAVDKVLALVSGWASMPDDLAKFMTKIPTIDEPNPRLCQKLLDDPAMPKPKDVKHYRMVVRALKAAMDKVIEVLPRDLSVNAVAVAGGGTEVSGHPVRWPFLLARQIFELTDEVMTRYLELYAACSEQRWKTQVMEKLTYIEQHVGKAA